MLFRKKREERRITYDFFEVMLQVAIAMLFGMKIWDEIKSYGIELAGVKTMCTRGLFDSD